MGILCQGGHVDALLGEVPEHLDERIRKGVEVDVELAVCRSNVSFGVDLKVHKRGNKLVAGF